MFYPCTVKNAEGQVIKEYSPQELYAKHWGTNPICLGCGKPFSAISKGTPKGKFYSKKINHRSNIRPSGVAPRDLEYCNFSCKFGAKQKKKLAAIPIEPIYCEVCGEDMETRSKRRRFCPGKCKRIGENTLRRPKAINHTEKGKA